MYVGVDIGGTNIAAALVEGSGDIIVRNRRRTPRDAKASRVLDALLTSIEDLLDEGDIDASSLSAIGVGVAGPVDPEKGRVVTTPNMNLSGLKIAEPVEKHFGVPTTLENDVNVGMLGEAWVGAAKGARSAVGIFVGTGIGGGVICHGQLVTGARNTAGEIGHIVMQPDGPKCGCGQRGCLEALASRTAIERDIRQAVKSGTPTILTEMLDGDLTRIRSKALKKALKKKDALVTDVMRRASEYLGYACVTVRHLMDPEVIVLGGGVIEACGKYVMPLVEEILAARSMPGTDNQVRVVASALGDDAVVLGAVVLAQVTFGHRRSLDASEEPHGGYPRLSKARPGQVAVDDEVYTTDVVIRADGKVRKRAKSSTAKANGGPHEIGPDELKKVCKDSPETLIIGTGYSSSVVLTKPAETFLRDSGITVKLLETPQAVVAFNQTKRRKAALIHVTC